MQPAPAAAPTAAWIGEGERTDGDNGRFAAAVAAVTSAFGDPTRREIFLYVRAQPGATTAEVATRFSLHPNVARHHLDRLVAGGYLQVAAGRAGTGRAGTGRPGTGRAGTGRPGTGRPGAGRPGAGRPAKRYLPVGDDPTIELLTRRDDLLVSLLQEALELLGPEAAERMAAKVGEDYGRRLASRMAPGEGQRSVRAAMHAIAETLTAHGFAAHAEDQGAATAVVAEQCPFGDAALTHPVLCAVDRGMVKGLLAGLCKEVPEGSMPVVLSSRARGDDTCAALA
ncbi:MAG TPA: helix-turn-helix domain-containing protein [Acidimicrobiales bacterium]|nr:helix-turn-helix domain-containing protein [Acidimicrobiales bacterium]